MEYERNILCHHVNDGTSILKRCKPLQIELKGIEQHFAGFRTICTNKLSFDPSKLPQVSSLRMASTRTRPNLVDVWYTRELQRLGLLV